MRTERRILSGTEENPITVVETRWEDDGSRVESFQDYRTGAANFTVYNAQGKMVHSVRGNFDTPKKPEPSAQTQSEWQLPRRDAQEPSQPAAQMPTWQYSQEPPRQQSQIPTQPTAPVRLPEKKAPLEINRPLAVSAAVLSALLLLFTCATGFLNALVSSRNQVFGYNSATVMEYFMDNMVKMLPSMLLSVLMIAALVRFRKDWFMGVYLSLLALWNLRSFVIAVVDYRNYMDYMRFYGVLVVCVTILLTALHTVMAVDCFWTLRMPAGVRWLLFGGGSVLLVILNVAAQAYLYHQFYSGVEGADFLLTIAISILVPNLIGNIPLILLGFALAGAKPRGIGSAGAM